MLIILGFITRRQKEEEDASWCICRFPLVRPSILQDQDAPCKQSNSLLWNTPAYNIPPFSIPRGMNVCSHFITISIRCLGGAPLAYQGFAFFLPCQGRIFHQPPFCIPRSVKYWPASTQYWFYWLLLLDNFGWICFAFPVRWKVPDKLWAGFLIPLFPALISQFIGVSCQVPGVHILPEVCGLHAFLDRWNVSVPDIIWIAFRRHNTPHSRPSSSNPPSSRLINRIKHDFVCRGTRLEQ